MIKLAEILPATPGLTPEAERLLDDLAASLAISPSRYEAAERSYKSVGEWLSRPGSAFARVGTTIYAQGSFRLATVIRPVNDDEDYDLDVVCEVVMPKSTMSQAEFKALMGKELTAYANAHSMATPTESRRAWRLDYADGAQFHMDVLASVPDGARQRMLLEARGLTSTYAQSAIALTCREHPNFYIHSEDWPTSNPKGYSEWFKLRMGPLFNLKRRGMQLAEAKASIEEIPEYRVRTPLQAAIQILKRHRDIRFIDDAENRPISIVITTLAAKAYNQEATIGAALFGILDRMDSFIDYRDGVAWIENPADPRENFADKWQKHPEKAQAFRDWLEEARADFEAAARMSDLDELIDLLSPRLGRKLVESAANARRPTSLSTTVAKPTYVGKKLRRILNAPHKEQLHWPEVTQGIVRVTHANASRSGYRQRRVLNDGEPIPKFWSLDFEAKTDVPLPYDVYWQVVNTGIEASEAGGLRGGFDQGIAGRGTLTHHESTSYAGSHSIECFIVKNGYCVARSGAFVVNIK